MGDLPEDRTFPLVCPKFPACGYTEAKSLRWLYDNPCFRFVCPRCGYDATLEAKDIPGIREALRDFGKPQ